VQDVEDEPLFAGRVAGTGIAKAGMEATGGLLETGVLRPGIAGA
jgi:hypothetical protein